MSWERYVEEEQRNESWGSKKIQRTLMRIILPEGFKQWTRFTCWTWTNSKECWETSACYKLLILLRSLLSCQIGQWATSPLKCTKVTSPGLNSVAASKIRSPTLTSDWVPSLQFALQRSPFEETPPRDLKPHCLPLLTETWTSRHLCGFPRGSSCLESFRHLAIKSKIGGLLKWLKQSVWKDAESNC